MNLEFETLKLRLIETQMQLLQYQHRETAEAISKVQAILDQAAHNQAADVHDMPTVTKEPL